jgi:hypothetical protein
MKPSIRSEAFIAVRFADWFKIVHRTDERWSLFRFYTDGEGEMDEQVARNHAYLCLLRAEHKK